MENQKTKICLTSPDGDFYQLQSFDSLKISQSITNKVSSFSLKTTTFDESMLKKFSTGTEMTVYSCKESENIDNYLIYKGIIQSNPKTLNLMERVFEFSGYDKLTLTQDVIVDEAYENEYIHVIVRDLLQKCIDEKKLNLKIGYIEETTYKMDIRFNQMFLFTALERLSSVLNFTFSVDLNDFFTFRSINSMTSNDVINIDMFYQGSANFSTDNSRLVNKVTVRGGISLSEDVTQKIKADGLNNTFILHREPYASSSGSVIIKVNGVQQAIGIKGMTEQNVDVLISFDEKNITFKDKTTGSDRVLAENDLIEVTYRYRNKLIRKLQDDSSIQKYGLKENIVSYPDITDISALEAKARDYLAKYSKPITTGSLSVWENNWNIGETVKIDIELEEGEFINEWLQISEKTTNIAPNEMKVDLKFEQKKSLDSVLKDILDRISEIEKQDENEEVTQLNIVNDLLSLKGLYKVYTGKKARFMIGKNKVGDCI